MTVRRTGTVERINDERTIAVLITRLVTHPKYLKKYRQSNTLLVDVQPTTKVEIGQVVTIEETRPISRSKHWRLVEVQEKK